MLRLNPNEVMLDDHEMMAKKKFEELLDEGYGIHDAVIAVKTRWPNLGDDFYEYLED